MVIANAMFTSNTSIIKSYTTRMAKIQGPDKGKTYSNIYKEHMIKGDTRG